MRPGIGEEEVKYAAEALKAAGRTVSIIAVREKLGGRGSYTTIKRHLDTWSQSEPNKQSDTPKVPPELLSSQTEALTLLWQSAILSAREILVDEIAKQAKSAAEKDQALAEAMDEITRLERILTDHDEIHRDQEITKRRLEDEIVELRTELTSTKTQALELKASIESSTEREQRANERAEANAALLADTRTQLNKVREGLECIGKEKHEFESKCLKLETQILTHQNELALSHQREEYAALELARAKERFIALESELQGTQRALSLAEQSIDNLRVGEKELKEALAQGQATERELRALFLLESERLSKMEASLDRFFMLTTSENEKVETQIWMKDSLPELK